MTSTFVEKQQTDTIEKTEYIYKFRVLGTIVNKKEIFYKVPIEQVQHNEEILFLRTLFSALRTFVGWRRVIIGLGPGRCGTMSLAALFAAQRDIIAHHESTPRLSWDASIYEFLGKWASLFYSVKPCLPVVADIANWYLPFVSHILEINDNVKFVCIKRDIDGIINSFMLKVPNTSHWTDVKSEHWHELWQREHGYRRHFPKYDLPKEEGCRKYVEEYYNTCDKYAELIPDKFRIFDIDSLNSTEGVKSILSFCGISEEDMEMQRSHINVTNDKHREIMNKYKDTYGENF